MQHEEKIKSFIESDLDFLVIEGAAGSGKTYLIGQIAGQLNRASIDHYLLAPTGRATRNLAERLRDITEVQPSTIHAFLYEKTESDDQDSEIIQFELKKPDIAQDAVIIIDESSMLSNQDNIDPLLKFGTGFLLNDLLSFIDVQNTCRKVIFVGDVYQLPPINEKSSITLDIERLKIFSHKNIEKIILNQVYRQDADSAILKTSNLLSEKIAEEKFLQLPIDLTSDDILDIDLDKALDAYMWTYQKKSIFIAYTNQEVHHINQKFREKSHYSPNFLEKSERLILTRSCWMNENKLYNGDFLYVKSVGTEEYRTISVPKKNQSLMINLSFLTVTLFDPQNNTHFTCKVLSHKLWNKNSEIEKTDESRALIIDFRKRNPDLKPKTPEYIKKIKTDPNFNALHVSFGYAITCHKAQGGEWDEAYISLYRPQNDLKTEGGFKWLYTAITRARQKVHLLYRPIEQDFDPNQPFKFLLANMKNNLEKNDFKLISHRELEYELHLYIERSGITTRFKIYRNSKMKLTTLMKINETVFSTELSEILQRYVNTSLIEDLPK
jgi:ATP-dependent exoDNAse (exonuclease V) alpha subunit